MPDTEPVSIRYVNGRRMQCKDIPDHVFLGAIRRTPGTPTAGTRNRWEVHVELEETIGPIPENLFLAKARRLVSRRLIGGCPCGCRGDYTVPGDAPEEPPTMAAKVSAILAEGLHS